MTSTTQRSPGIGRGGPPVGADEDMACLSEAPRISVGGVMPGAELRMPGAAMEKERRSPLLWAQEQGTVFVEYLVVLTVVVIICMVPLVMLGAALAYYYKANRIALVLPLL